jgi:hypothetical protein
MLTSVTGNKYWRFVMTLEQFIRGEAQGHWTLEVYGITPGYLEVRIAPDGDRDEAIEYLLVGNVLLAEPPEKPRPPEENEEGVWVDVTARAAELRAIAEARDYVKGLGPDLFAEDELFILSMPQRSGKSIYWDPGRESRWGSVFSGEEIEA